MTDKQLIELYQSSPKEAFALIVKANQEPIYWYIRKTVISHDDTNDIVQNTFMKAWKAFANFKGESQISTWLYTIARNESYTFLKKRNKSDKEVSVEILLENEIADGYFSGDDSLANLHLAVAKLPEKQKEVFVLKYFEDKTYGEIVEIIGGTVGSHKASYHHAVKKVEKYLIDSLNHKVIE